MGIFLNYPSDAPKCYMTKRDAWSRQEPQTKALDAAPYRESRNKNVSATRRALGAGSAGCVGQRRGLSGPSLLQGSRPNRRPHLSASGTNTIEYVLRNMPARSPSRQRHQINTAKCGSI